MIKSKGIYILLSLLLVISGMSQNAFGMDNEDDAFLESMMFGDIPEVFSALKISQNMQKAPASITVFTEDDISLSGARTIGDLLKYVPGLYVTSSRSGFDLLKVRGAQDRYNNRVLLIIDGIPRRELFYGYTSISDLVPVENIAQLEVIRGPGSALYGTNAYTGVISIFTKSADLPEKLKIDAGYGEFHTRKINIAYGERLGENAKISMNGRYFGSGGYDVERGRDGFISSETTQRKGYNFDLKFAYKDFTFLASHSVLDYRYPWAKILRIKDRTEKNMAYGIRYRRDIAEKIGLDINLYYNGFDFLEDLRQFNANGSDKKFTKSIQENSVSGLDTHVVYQLTPKNQLVVGGAVERENTGRNEEMTSTPGMDFVLEQWIQNDAGEKDFCLQNYAVYLEDFWKLNSQIELTVGGRYDVYEQFGNSFSPRLAAVYNPIKDMTLKAMYGEAFRGPTYKELFLKEFSGAAIVPSSRANPSLKAEKIKTSEVEVSYAINDNLLSKIRYFYNENDNAIISLAETVPYENLDGIKTNGVEIELDFSYKELAWSSNATFTRGKKSGGDILDGYPDFQVNSVVDFSPNEHFDTRLGVRFISERNRPTDYHAGLDPADTDVGFLHGIDNLGSYFDVEFSLIYHFNDHWSIGGFIYNLFDAENYNPSYEPGEYWDLIHPGRAYYLNLTYRLSN